MVDEGSVVAIYDTHTDAEAAVKGLETAGIDIKRLSIIGKVYRNAEHVVGYYRTGDRLKYWGKLGAFWGGMWGLLVGSAFFWMPGLGPILVGGPFVSSIVGALEGATIYGSLSVLGAALYSMGIPRNSVINYESALRANKFLLIIQGTEYETFRSKEILRTTEAIELSAHDRSGVEAWECP